MYKFVKALHFIGIAMFFGSILAHATAGLVPRAQEDTQIALVVRQAIDVATTYLTVPGLVLLIVTGGFMIIKGKLSVSKKRWLMLHVIFGLIIALNTAFFLIRSDRIYLMPRRKWRQTRHQGLSFNPFRGVRRLLGR